MTLIDGISHLALFLIRYSISPFTFHGFILIIPISNNFISRYHYCCFAVSFFISLELSLFCWLVLSFCLSLKAVFFAYIFPWTSSFHHHFGHIIFLIPLPELLCVLSRGRNSPLDSIPISAIWLFPLMVYFLFSLFIPCSSECSPPVVSSFLLVIRWSFTPTTSFP